MGILHSIPRKSSLFFFVLFACVLTTSQFVLRTRVVQAGKITGPQDSRVAPTPQPSPSPPPELRAKKTSSFRKILHFLTCNQHKRIKEQELFGTGPQLPDSYTSSDFSFPALVQGGWPAVVAYKLEIQNEATITVEVKDVEPFVQKLTGTGGQQEMMFIIPQRFGSKPQAALISIKAFPGNPREKKPADFRLQALGMGDEAVESVPIKLKYEPEKVNTARGETLNYSYSSSKRFADIRAEFWRARISRGRRKPVKVNSTELGAIQQSERKSNRWDGRRNIARDRKFSLGSHEFDLNARVRRGAWIIVWSGEITVE